MKKTLSIIGSGSWGTALAILLSSNSHNVRLWSYHQHEADMLNMFREHKTKLPGVIIPDDILCTSDIEEALHNTDVTVLAVPSQTVRQNSELISKYIRSGAVVVCCSKGLEQHTGLRLTQVINQQMSDCIPVVLSGPSHAEEVSRNIPTAIVAASEDIAAAKMVQDIFMAPNFRVYTNSDVIGVELGGALKNVIALCAGISDGLEFGDNTKAALMTRGIAEMTRLGVAMGANAETFAGLSGIGDLIVTCTSMHSRNRRAGILIGQGKTLDQAHAEIQMVIEGVSTTQAAYDLAVANNISMPITVEAYYILFEGKKPKQAVTDLMTRDKKHESGI